MKKSSSLPEWVGQWQEDALVRELVSLLPRWDKKQVPVGPGDDCALVRPWSEAREGIEGAEFPPAGQLLKVDALIEGVHFLRAHPARQVGWKALARPLSDIGAMGGVPQFALVSAAVPEDLPTAYLLDIYRGLARAARRFGVQVVGGETARSPAGIFLSLTLTGICAGEVVPCRSGARDGDEIWVTGILGRSYASGHHLRFIPRVAEARWLLAHFPPSALMDLSDGLGADLPRLSRLSNVGFAVDLPRVPRRRGASLEEALGEGEDYELLFTLAPEKGKGLWAEWKRRFPRVRLTRIGKMSRGGERVLPVSGYGHFL